MRKLECETERCYVWWDDQKGLSSVERTHKWNSGVGEGTHQGDIWGKMASGEEGRARAQVLRQLELGLGVQEQKASLEEVSEGWGAMGGVVLEAGRGQVTLWGREWPVKTRSLEAGLLGPPPLGPPGLGPAVPWTAASTPSTCSHGAHPTERRLLIRSTSWK